MYGRRVSMDLWGLINILTQKSVSFYFTYFLLIITLSYAHIPKNGSNKNQHTLILKVTTGDSIYSLPHRFLIPESIQLIRGDSIRISPSEYTLNPLTGDIRFLNVSDSGFTVSLIYQFLPIQLETEYYHWTALDSVSDMDSSSSYLSMNTKKQRKSHHEVGQELSRSGSIFRSISLGTNQGMRLQSGLRLQVSGKVAPHIEIIASLTDQNTPIQPEGNTQTLQEIDKVFIRMKAPHMNATFGDFVYANKGSHFGTFTRKLQGAMGTLESDIGQLTVMASASKGEFTTNHFVGQEGNQGPYQLIGDGGELDIIILAGTERVWIDGELMVRGENNDYFIEYGVGQITFTRNRLITADSRITVDFEYSSQKFQKNIYGVSGNIGLWNNRFTFQSSFYHEADNKDNALDITFTDEHKAVLKNIGDETDSATVSGINYVGENQGEYRKVQVSGQSAYEFVGKNQGEYNIRFSYVGYGNGDYSYQGYGIYHYEGYQQGSYLPVIFLPLAKSHQLWNMQTSVEVVHGLSVNSEIAFSHQDRNLFSSIDDQDNLDMAYRGRLMVNEQKIVLMGKNLGSYGFSTHYHTIGKKFRPVGRINEIEYGRKWGIEEGIFWNENVTEIQGFYKPIPKCTISGEYGSFNRGDSFQSERRVISTSLLQPKIPQMNYHAEIINTTQNLTNKGRWFRQKGTIDWKLFGLHPTVEYENEHRQENNMDSIYNGFRFDQLTSGLMIDKQNIQIDLKRTVRDDQKYLQGLLKPHSIATTDRYRMNIHLRRELFSSLMFTHHERSYRDLTLPDQKSNLADATFRISPKKNIFNCDLNYRFSSTQVAKLVRDTLYVGEGLGNYRYDKDLEEFIPDPDGDLIYRTIQTDTYLPANDLKSSFEFRFNGSALWTQPKGFQKFLKTLRTHSMIRIERRDKERNFIKINQRILQPRWGNDTTLVMGSFSFLQDLNFNLTQQYGFRIRFRKEDSETHQYINEGLIHHRVEKSVQMKGYLTEQLGFFTNFENRSESKTNLDRLSSSRKLQLNKMIMEISYRPSQLIELALKTKFGLANDRFPEPHTNASFFFLVPRFGYGYKNRANLRAEFEIGNVKAKPGNRTLPYELLDGDQKGRTIRWTLLFTYRITGHVMATLNYRGRNEPWREELFQNGQIEVRAFF